MAVAAGEDEDRPNFKKMRVKELKALLKERGVDSKGYGEKSDLVKKVEETYHLPVLPPPPPPPEAEAPDLDLSKMGDIPGMDPAAMERMMAEMKGDFSHVKDKRRRKLLETLKKSGMSVSGVSSMDIDQLENLANMMGQGGMGGPASPKKSSKKKAGAEGVGVQPWHKDALVKFYAKHGMWAVFQSRCLVSLLLLVAASFPS